MKTALAPSVFQVSLNDQSLRDLCALRERLSRLFYAPSKKTLLRVLIIYISEDLSFKREDIQEGENFYDHRFQVKIPAQVELRLQKRFGALGGANAIISTILSSILSEAGKTNIEAAILGKLLMHIRRQAYLKHKGVILLRMPTDLKEQLLRRLSSNYSDSEDTDLWKSRCQFQLRAEQVAIQAEIRSVLSRFSQGNVSRWSIEQRRKAIETARAMLEKTDSLCIINLNLPKDVKIFIRDKFHSDEVMIVAWIVFNQELSSSHQKSN